MGQEHAFKLPRLDGSTAPLADRKPTLTHSGKAPHFDAAATSAPSWQASGTQRAIWRCSKRSRQ